MATSRGGGVVVVVVLGCTLRGRRAHEREEPLLVEDLGQHLCGAEVHHRVGHEHRGVLEPHEPKAGRGGRGRGEEAGGRGRGSMLYRMFKGA